MNIQRLEGLKEFAKTINRRKYDQDLWEECESCGCLAKYYTNQDDYSERDEENLKEEFELLESEYSYLFGLREEVKLASNRLNLPVPKQFGLKSAIKRIDNLINLQKQRDSNEYSEA